MSNYSDLLARLQKKTGPINLSEIVELLEEQTLPENALGPGSVVRSVAGKLGETVSVRDFGAVGDGVTDNASAFALAVASGASLFVPAGLYLTSDDIDLTNFTGRYFVGAGKGVSEIRRTNKSGPVFTVGGSRIRVADLALGFDPASPPTASDTNAHGIKANGTLLKSSFHNLLIKSCYNSIDLNTSAGHNTEFKHIDCAGFVNGAVNKGLTGGYTQLAFDHIYMQNQNFGKSQASGTLAAVGSTTEVTLASTSSSVDDYYKGARLLVSGTKTAYILSYVGATKVATLVAQPRLASDWTTTTVSPGNAYVIDHLSETVSNPFLLQACNDVNIGCIATEWITLPTAATAPVNLSECNNVVLDCLRFEGVIWKAANGAAIQASGSTKVTLGSLQGNYSVLSTGFGAINWFLARMAAQATVAFRLVDLRSMFVVGTSVKHARSTGVRTVAPYGGAFFDQVFTDSSITPDPAQGSGTTYDNAGPAGQGAIRGLKMEASATWDIPSTAAGATSSTTVTVNGAQRGDRVRAVFSLDLGGLLLFAQVTAANTVTVRVYNPTGSPIDVGSGILYVEVDKVCG